MSQQHSHSMAGEKAKRCGTCNGVMFFVLTYEQFYCKNCRYYLTLKDDAGNSLRNIHNPFVTPKQIEEMRERERKNSGKPAKIWKVTYKLSHRPSIKGAK